MKSGDYVRQFREMYLTLSFRRNVVSKARFYSKVNPLHYDEAFASGAVVFILFLSRDLNP